MNTNIYNTKKSISDYIKNTPILVVILYIILVAIGLLGSLKIVLKLFGADADSVDTLMLWYGIQDGGLSWLKDWIFTEDNWLFSLAPFHFLGFSIFGPKISIVIIFGWVIYLLSAFSSAAIAWKAGARTASFFIFIILINLGFYAHSTGFVSYSISHNISNLFGLVSVFLFISWIKAPKLPVLLLLFLILTTGVTSDPWMLASYNLPFFVTGIFFYFFFKDFEKKKIILFCALMLMSIVLLKTKLFGLLSFLPGEHFKLAHWHIIQNNASYLIKDFGGLINFIPFLKENSLTSGFISFGILVLLTAYAFIKINKTQSLLLLERSGVALTLISFISISCIFAAFILTSREAFDYSARYLINASYLGVIILGVAAEYGWKKFGIFYRSMLILVIFMFMSANIVSMSPYLFNQPFSFKDNSIFGTINFLKKQGLTYGYGPYWGSNANAVTAMSKQEIRLRPATFDKKTGEMVIKHPQASKQWRLAKDIPPGTSQFFVFIVSDFEECSDISLCVSGLEKQFGPPIKSIPYGNGKILVWHIKVLKKL